MSEAKDEATREAKAGLHFVAAPASGWCEPDTGVCHIDSVDETVEEDRER